jgi:hypothetical protein
MSSRRELTRLAGVLALAGCAHAAEVSGKIPERTPREPDATAPIPLDRAGAYAARRDRQTEPAGPVVEKVDPVQARVGVVSTQVFHAPACPLLTGVPSEDQIRFTSPWEAIDARFRPCPKCRPGP